MNINIISLIGILLGVSLFIFLSVKGFQLLLTACAASFVVIATSGQPLMEMINVSWTGSLANFLQAYFLVLTLSAIIGKAMNDSGAAKRIAQALYQLCKKSKRNQKLIAAMFVPIMYVLLCYAGISGLVVVFTVLSIGKQILQEFDIPWRLYCYGGATSIVTQWMPGSLNLSNIAAANASGAGLAGNAGLGIVATVVYLAVAFFFLSRDLKTAERKGEGFAETGAGILAVTGKAQVEEKPMPSLIVSIIPLGVTIILAACFQMDIMLALFIGLLLCIVFFWKYTPSMKATLGDGAISSFAPVIGVGATAAFASVITMTPGFQIIVALLGRLPLLFEGFGFIALLTFIMASPVGSIASMGEKAMQCFTDAGLAPATSSTIIALSTFTTTSPHAPAIANATAVARLEYKRVIGIYLKVPFIGGALALAACILCIQFGLFG